MTTVENFAAKIARLLNIGSVNASPDGSLSLGVVYACVKIISETFGMLPLKHYERTENGRQELYNELTNTIAERPNHHVTASDFHATWLANALLYGVGYAAIDEAIERDDNGNRAVVKKFRNIQSTQVKQHKLKDGSLVYDFYWYGIDDNNFERRQEHEVLRLKGLGFDGYEFKAPVDYASQPYKFALYAQKYGSEFFENGAHLKGFIQLPEGQTIEGSTREERKSTWDRIKKGVLGGLKGTSSANEIGLLEAGMKWQAVSLPNDQAQFLESRKFSREEIASMFRLPPYMVGEMGGAIKSNIEQQSIEFIRYTIMPWVVKAEQELKYKLLKTKPTQIFKYDVNEYMRGTALERAQYLKEMRYAGLLTRQEARDYEDFPRNAEGEYMSPKNMWGAEEYELELLKRRQELGNTNE